MTLLPDVGYFIETVQIKRPFGKDKFVHGTIFDLKLQVDLFSHGGTQSGRNHL